ncbi:hypothetical protein [Microbacterium sp. NPDC057650]|uniref:hypothetical protein n=1 Tax=unclassified Microbacterium TaxID=2609290 RepID=UPI00366CC42F
MTVTAPDYTARILGVGGGPDVPVSMRTDAGSITLDVASAPHVSGAGITLALPDAALLDALDPRDSRRLVIDAGGRTFDLGIREATPNHGDATVVVELASDEALLDDFAQDFDDAGPRAHEASLRAVTGYVLGSIGAALQPGGPDADVTCYWEVALLNSNPAGILNAAGYWHGTGASGLTSVAVVSPAPALGGRTVRWTAAAGVSSVGVAGWDGVSTTKEGRVTPGKPYSAVVRVLSNPGRSTTVTIGFRDENGKHFSNAVSPAQVTSITAWTEFHLSAVAPAGAAYAYAVVTTNGNTAGQNHWVQAMLYEGADRIPMFYGDSTGGGYTYAWSGDANASPCTRTPVIERPLESLTWQAGVSGLAFLRPLLIAAGIRLVCDEARLWTLRDDTYRADGAQTYRVGVNITQVDEKLSRAAEEWFDGMVVQYTWTDADGIEQTRYDSYALTANPTKTIRREVAAPYPGPGRAQYAVTRAQGRGRTVTVTRQAHWDEHAEQPLSVLLDGTPIQTGLAEKVTFDLAGNTVTTSSRTTDTPAEAWQLIPAGEAWLDSPIGASWTEEVP